MRRCNACVFAAGLGHSYMVYPGNHQLRLHENEMASYANVLLDILGTDQQLDIQQVNNRPLCLLEEPCSTFARITRPSGLGHQPVQQSRIFS
jgi:hypothetical protein